MAKAKILRTDAELHIVEDYMADLEGRRPKHLKNPEVLEPAPGGQGGR